MKFPKILIPFLAVVLPSMRFEKENPDFIVSTNLKDTEEITRDESVEKGIILRRFSDSDRFPSPFTD